MATDITAVTNQTSATDGAVALAGIKTALTSINTNKAELVSPSFTTPALGTPSSGVATNLTGTATALNIGGNAATVTTNANLSGDVSSVGNTTTIGAGKVTEAMQVLADNTTNDASTTKHGYMKKLPNTASTYYDGTGNFSTPSVSGTPAWVDEGSASWAASSADKTITLTNTGKDLYALYITFSVGAAAISLRFNSDTGAHYHYRQYTNNAVSQATGQTSLQLVATTSNVCPFMSVSWGPLSNGNVVNVAVTGGAQNTNGAGAITLSGAWDSGATITSVTIMVDGVTMTGKAHLYSLSL